ncbi:hypothetical protein GGS21DRAFT_537670 [Xylaria nigripes]|nr:hypothetical protein GGS21DRAFT_537670 [Xylaria nigripes]
MQANRSSGGPLEDRLRSLILTSSDTGSEPSNFSNTMSSAKLTNITPSEPFSSTREESEDDRGRPNTSHPPKGGRKRLSQAQRRRRNAEMSIPIDYGGPSSPSLQQYTNPQNRREPQSFEHGRQQNLFPSNTPAYSDNNQAWSTSNLNSSYGQTRRGYIQSPQSFPTHQSDRRRQQDHNTDAISRDVKVVSTDTFPPRGGGHQFQTNPAFYKSGANRQSGFSPEQLESQSGFLDRLCYQITAGAEIQPGEIAEKENFRMYVEAICRDVVARYEIEANCVREFDPRTVELKCFGSLASGFATKGSDMDLGLLSPMSRLPPDSPESPIPRLIEGALLASGFGARLLTRARVPIIKLCQSPNIALQQKLQDARKKWETGLDQGEREPDDDAPDDPEPPTIKFSNDSDSLQNLTKVQGPQLSDGGTAVPAPEEELFTLRQSGNQSLAAYYGNAKRILRRLDGRDITHSNSQDFTKADYVLLDKVADAFIKGLYDSDLRDRILAYPSFHTDSTTQLTNYRSLFGVNTMVEGEQLVFAWETRSVSSRNPKVDQVYGEYVGRWHRLQCSKNFGTNPIWFNKELQLAVEALRQFSPLQIMQLQQDQYESPIQYHERTYKIAMTLSGTSSVPDADVRSQVISYYINGIRAGDIRNELRDFAASTGTQSLRTIARKHKSLHLATDYERALEDGLYRLEDVSMIQSYISILRRKPVPSIEQPTDFEYLIPVMQSEVDILDRIRQLSDPATLGPNKPKDRYSDSLEFPKNGVGVQCDVNFSAHLALQNTLLLRCYSYSDSRVRPLVLFVKTWAKTRGINTPYRGTLSSYGYVLMVLHYLVNVVEPFVCPNLQQLAPPDPELPPEALEGLVTCQGYNVRFWRDERAIQSLALQGQLNQNRESLGDLLRGFFEYYAQGNMMISKHRRAFDWGRDVISLRTHGGLLSKAEKGWTGAKTVVHLQNKAPLSSAEHAATTSRFTHPNHRTTDQSLLNDETAQWGDQQQTSKSMDVKEVRHRFLFAIEDPFETDHNVARTVTHNGIVSIRNEFRRAWNIIKSAGNGYLTENLLEDVKVQKEQLERQQFLSLLDELHSNKFF